MRCKLDTVDGTFMQPYECFDEDPFPLTGFAVDEDGAVEGCGGEECAVFGVGPGELVDWTRVTGEGGVGSVGVSGDIVNFYSAVRR
mmetsp:Transcript_15964/g.24845  ORF Transcript_15964/g.24845 Transcript_15964/m.24845 type:complete len:86 (-) Transcript_15964:368-625(-)